MGHGLAMKLPLIMGNEEGASHVHVRQMCVTRYRSELASTTRQDQASLRRVLI